MIEDRIREIQERLQATTPGEWKRWEHDGDYFGDDSPTIVTQAGEYIAQTNYDGAHDRDSAAADAEFIAHAKSDIAFLLSEVRKMISLKNSLSNDPFWDPTKERREVPDGHYEIPDRWRII